ncbi:hypothetical protein K458DRAFT_459739 [Lentithecium fluviatile CBS 122367]|uniref:C2H2-type domain-containing protein n=1 Tax=Lentithecium fluviatile CBS 122367 TaxID=1168545 RepID=A0A6G1JJ15_9PLEO|nr:hypothetical protein K458DRAFT_459739 [Lentithecium fluviatile CBS 122367]
MHGHQTRPQPFNQSPKLSLAKTIINSACFPTDLYRSPNPQTFSAKSQLNVRPGAELRFRAGGISDYNYDHVNNLPELFWPLGECWLGFSGTSDGLTDLISLPYEADISLCPGEPQSFPGVHTIGPSLSDITQLDCENSYIDPRCLCNDFENSSTIPTTFDTPFEDLVPDFPSAELSVQRNHLGCALLPRTPLTNDPWRSSQIPFPISNPDSVESGHTAGQTHQEGSRRLLSYMPDPTPSQNCDAVHTPKLRNLAYMSPVPIKRVTPQFACKESGCSARFVERRHLDTHRRTTHARYSCNACTKTYPHRKSL